MRDAKDQVMSYIMQQFQMMLEDNYDEYCEQFENYLRFRHNEEFHANKHDHKHDHWSIKACFVQAFLISSYLKRNTMLQHLNLQYGNR